MYNFGSRDEYGGGDGGENLPGVPDQSVEEWGGRMIYCRFSSNRILPYFPLFVRVSVTGVTSHIYKGINAMLIIRGPINPYII